MNINGFGNNYQTTSNMTNNGYGNNYSIPTTTTPVNNMATNPVPISIGFVRGKMGVSTFPIMSSNTTVYLFDVLDQNKFYVKATDAFGMAMPIREFEYHEIVQQLSVPNILPTSEVNDNEQNNFNNISKEEFDDLKAQLADLSQQVQLLNKTRKDKANNVLSTKYEQHN